MNSEPWNLMLYSAKCVVVTSIIYLLSRWLNYQEIIWPLVSAILVLSHDSADAVLLATTRIAANMIGSATSLLCLLLGPTSFVILCLAIVLTIGLCALSRLMAGSRSALAAAVIIMLHEPGMHPWDAVLKRAGSVVAGCLLGLVVTFAFHQRLLRSGDNVAREQAE